MSGRGTPSTRPGTNPGTNTGEEAWLSLELIHMLLAIAADTVLFFHVNESITIDTTGGVNYGQQGFGFGE